MKNDEIRAFFEPQILIRQSNNLKEVIKLIKQLVESYENNDNLIDYWFQSRTNRPESITIVFMSLLKVSLKFEPSSRLSAEEFIKHPFFKPGNNRNVIIVKRLDKKALFSDPLLLSAAQKHNIDLVLTCLKICADPNIKDNDGNTALHLAASNKDDNKVMIELLLEYGADIDRQNKDGTTCLMVAAFNNNIAIVRCLLLNGADINKKDNNGSNVLHYVATNYHDNKFIIELLLENGADIDSQNEKGETCLMHAARNNKIEIVRCLLQNGADINKKNNHGGNVLHFVAGYTFVSIFFPARNKNDNKFIIELLLEYGADIDSQNEKGETCLMLAAEYNKIEIVRCLLQNGADINKQSRFGNTALDRARSNGKDNKEIVELLLDYERPFFKPGNDRNVFNVKHLDKKALISDRNVIIVKPLDKKALIFNPSLLSAAEKNNIDLVRTLLEQCADPNIQDDYDNTALNLVALNKDDNYLLVELLLEYGVDIDNQNECGFTCLMTAARNNNIEIVRCLLHNGADINKENIFGKTALQIANGEDNKEIVELLLYYEEKKSTFF